MKLEQAIDEISSYLTQHPDSCIFLQGDLGAGKTYFTNQFAKHIGITRHLPSPTFTFLQEYSCDWEGKRKLVHCDFYRIESEKADKTLEQIGFWDFVDERNILFIEWPERAISQIDALPHKTLRITSTENGERNYEFT